MHGHVRLTRHMRPAWVNKKAESAGRAPFQLSLLNLVIYKVRAAYRVVLALSIGRPERTSVGYFRRVGTFRTTRALQQKRQRKQLQHVEHRPPHPRTQEAQLVFYLYTPSNSNSTLL